MESLDNSVFSEHDGENDASLENNEKEPEIEYEHDDVITKKLK